MSEVLRTDQLNLSFERCRYRFDSFRMNRYRPFSADSGRQNFEYKILGMGKYDYGFLTPRFHGTMALIVDTTISRGCAQVRLG